MTKYAFTVEPSGHAKLSASSASRWLACPGSVALSAGLPNVSSEYAAQGAAAHWIAAACQNDGGSPDRWLGKTALVEGFEIALDEELVGAVKMFLDYIAEHERPGDRCFVEQSFTPAMRRLHEEFGGSTDRVMWRESERLIRVYDYKHGAGVAVEVDDNKQLKYYALGALLANPQWNAETVEMVIAQPRCEHEDGRIRSSKFAAIELVDYAADLVEGAKATEEFGAPLNPGDKQCKFCPAASKCPALEGRTHALIAQEFEITPDKPYDLAKLAEALRMAPLVEARITALREFAYAAACRGEIVPGFKLVDKRATRKWKDEAEARKLADAMFPGGDHLEEKFRSPAQIEKLMGKKKFEPIFAQHVEKVSSGHTLAPESDPRAPAQLAQVNDFEVIAAPSGPANQEQ